MAGPVAARWTAGRAACGTDDSGAPRPGDRVAGPVYRCTELTVPPAIGAADIVAPAVGELEPADPVGGTCSGMARTEPFGAVTEVSTAIDASLSVEFDAVRAAAPTSGACAISADGSIVESTPTVECSSAAGGSATSRWTGWAIWDVDSSAKPRETVGPPALLPDVGDGYGAAVLLTMTGSGRCSPGSGADVSSYRYAGGAVGRDRSSLGGLGAGVDSSATSTIAALCTGGAAGGSAVDSHVLGARIRCTACDTADGGGATTSSGPPNVAAGVTGLARPWTCPLGPAGSTM